MLHAYIIQPRFEVITAFLKLGYRVTQVLDCPPQAQEAFRSEYDFLTVSSIGNVVEIVDAIYQSNPIAGEGTAICIGLGDQSSLVASLVNELLGVAKTKYTSPLTLSILRNKPLLRSVLDSSLPQYSGYFRVVNSLDEVYAVFRKINRALVVKPLNGSGSRGVFRIQSETDILNNSASMCFPALIEEYFCGDEFSIEAITINGKHQPLAVTQKVLGGESGVVEIGQIQPADIGEESKVQLMEAATSLLDAINFRFGLSHTEIILSDGVPKIVESHGRVGGDRIADLLRFTTGHDAFEWLAFALSEERFLPIEPIAYSSRIDFVDLLDHQGSDQEWKDKLLCEPNVYSAEVLKPVGERGAIRCSADRHAFVISVFEGDADQ